MLMDICTNAQFSKAAREHHQKLVCEPFRKSLVAAGLSVLIARVE
jgi:hypothetical protein